MRRLIDNAVCIDNERDSSRYAAGLNLTFEVIAQTIRIRELSGMRDC